MGTALALVATWLGAVDAWADPPALEVDGGLVMAMPAALPTGLSLGVGAGVTRGERGGTLAYGLRTSWTTATEYTLDSVVSHDDLRLRATGVAERHVGRGTWMLRLGLGGTLVHEVRTRDQGMRAGLTGPALETTAWSLLPAADLEVGVALRLVGCWSLTLSGGPSVDVFGGALRGGWVGGLGASWHD